MRSQVQVLAGPPPIVAGQSAAGTELGALAAPLGPRWGRTPIPAGPSSGPSGSAHPGVRLGDDHPPWPRTQPEDASHAAGAATSRGNLAPVPTAPPPATARRTPAGPAWSLSGKRGRRGPTNPAAGVHHRPPTDQPDFGSVARVPASWTIRSSRRRPGSRRGLHPFSGHGRPATSTWSPTPPPEHGRRQTRPDGRLDTRRLDSGRLDTGRVDSRRPTAGPAGRRPQVTGHRTAGQPGSRTPRPDGWTPDGWTPATDAVACLLAVSTTATTPERSIPAGRCSGPTPSGRATTRTAPQQGRRGHARCYGWVWAPPRPSAAGGTPPSSWRLGALLSSEDFGSSVERDGGGQVLWRVQMRADAVVFSVWCW